MPSEEDKSFFRDLDLKFQRSESIEFLSYWNAKRGARRFPARADIVPREIIKLLPWINIYDVIDGGRDFHIRLIGTALTTVLGEDEYRGQPISNLPPLLAQRIHTACNWVLETQAPIRTYAHQSVIPGQDFQGAESCLAPLSSDGETIDVIIVLAMLNLRK